MVDFEHSPNLKDLTCASARQGHGSKIGQGQMYSPEGEDLSINYPNPNAKIKNILKLHRVRTATLGMLIPQGKSTLQESATTKKFPVLCKRLKKFMKSHRPDFSFTSIQVNSNTTSKPHLDGGNNGPSVIVGAGSYNPETGGRTVMWPGLKKNHVRLKSATRDWEESKKIPEPKYKFNIKIQSLMFNGNTCWHASETFTGRRWSFVFYNNFKKNDK